jgi:uncharacterized protein (DUF488 family)
MAGARSDADRPAPTVWTVGHSTRTLDELVALLRAHRVDTVVDVRTLPRSRRHPHFAKEALTARLPAAGIAYLHMPGLGGLRKPRKDSPNAGWRNQGFRGYADYMQTEEFAHHVEALLRLAGSARLTVMCAEAVPWRCHRSLISDALVVRGAHILHITSHAAPSPHVLTSWAHQDGVRLTYPPVQGELAL